MFWLETKECHAANRNKLAAVFKAQIKFVFFMLKQKKAKQKVFNPIFNGVCHFCIFCNLEVVVKKTQKILTSGIVKHSSFGTTVEISMP